MPSPSECQCYPVSAPPRPSQAAARHEVSDHELRGELLVDDGEQGPWRGRLGEHGVLKLDPMLTLDQSTSLEQGHRVVAELLEGQVEDVAIEVNVFVLTSGCPQDSPEVFDVEFRNGHPRSLLLLM